MASLIDKTYFNGDLSIPQLSQASVEASLQVLIDKFEPQLLEQLLGYKLHKAYVAGIAVGSPDAKWTELRDGKEYTDRFGRLTKWRGLEFADGTSKKSLIASYVYYWYLRDQSTQTAGTGEVASDNQNAKPVSSAGKQSRAWNEMVEWNKSLVEFLLSNEATYPDFTSDHYPMFFDFGLTRPINAMNL